jgi:mRNA-degrading endonuclease toxin of MazEF toxin-antitoxin module
LGKLSTGLRRKSFAMCEQIRVISHDRLDRRLGAVADATLAEVGELLKWIIDLA